MGGAIVLIAVLGTRAAVAGEMLVIRALTGAVLALLGRMIGTVHQLAGARTPVHLAGWGDRACPSALSLSTVGRSGRMVGPGRPRLKGGSHERLALLIPECR